MNERAAERWRPIVIAFTVGMLMLGGLVLFLVQPEKPRVPVASIGTGSATANVTTPSVVTAAPTSASATAAPAPSLIALGSTAPRRRLLPSDPDPKPDVLYPGANGRDFDPFEPTFRGDDAVRTLATSGAIRVGVPKTAEVRDERRVKAILGDLAAELDAKEKGRTDDFEARAHEYQDMLHGYGDKLRPYMSGSFAFHGDRWVLFGIVPKEASGDAGS